MAIRPRKACKGMLLPFTSKLFGVERKVCWFQHEILLARTSCWYLLIIMKTTGQRIGVISVDDTYSEGHRFVYLSVQRYTGRDIYGFPHSSLQETEQYLKLDYKNFCMFCLQLFTIHVTSMCKYM